MCGPCQIVLPAETYKKLAVRSFGGAAINVIRPVRSLSSTLRFGIDTARREFPIRECRPLSHLIDRIIAWRTAAEFLRFAHFRTRRTTAAFSCGVGSTPALCNMHAPGNDDGNCDDIRNSGYASGNQVAVASSRQLWIVIRPGVRSFSPVRRNQPTPSNMWRPIRRGILRNAFVAAVRIRSATAIMSQVGPCEMTFANQSSVRTA